MFYGDILRTGQISRLLGVNVRTTLGWIERGDLKAYQLPGRGDNRVLRSDLLQFLTRYGMPVPEELSRTIARVLILGRKLREACRMADVLRAAGIEAEAAGSVFQAGARFESFGPNVFILAPTAPEWGAIEAMKFIRAGKGYRRTKILAVAGPSRREATRCLKSGADLVLRSPVTPREVLKAVRQLLGARNEDAPRPAGVREDPASPGNPRLLLVGRGEDFGGTAGLGQTPEVPPFVDFTRSVNEAVRRLTGERYDALVCWAEEQEDLAGVIRIRKRRPEVPIVVVTTRKDSGFRSLASQMGATRILRKPARLSGLLKMLRLAVRNGELSAGLGAQAREAQRKASDVRVLSRETARLADQALTRTRDRR